VRIGVVDAFDRDLLDVCTEELPREIPRALNGQPVPGVELAAVDPLQD